MLCRRIAKGARAACRVSACRSASGHTTDVPRAVQYGRLRRFSLRLPQSPATPRLEERGRDVGHFLSVRPLESVSKRLRFSPAENLSAAVSFGNARQHHPAANTQGFGLYGFS